jgi:adenosylhomocysteine nucleosidase
MKVVVLISANCEWQAVKDILSPLEVHSTPLGEYFDLKSDAGTRDTPTRFFHSGWGKVSSAAATQYAIDRWQPDLLVNLGTCGGFEGRIQRGTVILVEKMIIYDILEQMFEADESIAYYSTELDLSWLDASGQSSVVSEQWPFVRGLLVSGDRDIVASDIPMLVEKYGAVAADWESGAIAWTAKRNSVRCLILRGVTDLVGAGGGEAYSDNGIFIENMKKVMAGLIEQLPAWLEKAGPAVVSPSPLFRKVDCIRLYVSDLEAGLSFYRDKLGHRLVWRSARAAGLRMSDSEAEIVIQSEDKGQEVDLTVRSADEAAQRFADADGEVTVPPFDIQIGRCAVVRDPWGNQLVLLDNSKGLLKTDEEGNVIGNL